MQLSLNRIPSQVLTAANRISTAGGLRRRRMRRRDPNGPFFRYFQP